jgi:hypothetical protein
MDQASASTPGWHPMSATDMVAYIWKYLYWDIYMVQHLFRIHVSMSIKLSENKLNFQN